MMINNSSMTQAMITRRKLLNVNNPNGPIFSVVVASCGGSFFGSFGPDARSCAESEFDNCAIVNMKMANINVSMVAICPLRGG